MPAHKQDVPERRASCGKNKKVGDVRKGPTMMTRSMRRKRQNLCDSVESLPSLSGILIQAINLCKSAKGLSFTQLNEVLGAKGYNVSRYCPSVKRQLKLLSSKGALMKMTHKAGSSFFVIRKHRGKEAATQALEGSGKIIGTKKTAAERTNSQRASEKMKGAAQKAKSSGLKSAVASRKSPRLNRKQKPGEKQLRQPPSSAKTFQRPIKKTVSTIKRPSSSATGPVPATKSDSSSKPASSRKRVRYLRSTAVNSGKKSGSPTNPAVSKRSNGVAVSAKGLRSRYSHAARDVMVLKYSRSKAPSTSKR